MNLGNWLKISIILAITYLSGCAGQQTFNHLARSGLSGTHGDTVAVAAGWKKSFSKNSITVSITDLAGTQTIYSPGSAEIRAVINMYPDPLSNIVVSRESGMDTSPSASIFASQVSGNYTGGDKDWWQTIVFIDLPNGMALGQADIQISTLEESMNSKVEIVAGDGSPNPFSAYYPWGASFAMTSDQLTALERSGHYQIDFSGGATVPAAISVEMTHDADVDNGGVGRTFVVNPTGEVKNIHWTDDGFTAKAIIMPASSAGLSSLTDFKFYVGGGVGNLLVSSVQAYDVNGDPIPSVYATVTQR